MMSFLSQGMAYTSEETRGRVPLRQSGVETNCSHPLAPPMSSNVQYPISTSSTKDGIVLPSVMTCCPLSFRAFFMPSIASVHLERPLLSLIVGPSRALHSTATEIGPLDSRMMT